MLSNLKIPRELRRKIDNELQPGEFIRWVEQPIPRCFTAASIVIVLFGILWTSLVISFMWSAAGFSDLREGLQHPNLPALFFCTFCSYWFLGAVYSHLDMASSTKDSLLGDR